MQPDPDDVIRDLQQSIGHGGTELFDVAPNILRTVLRRRIWADRRDRQGVPFPTFESFVTSKLWWGLQSTVPDLLAFCRKAPDVQAMIRAEVEPAKTHAEAGAKGGATAGRGRPKKQAVANSNSLSGSGTEATYTLRRLKRDRPELAARVVAGEITANAAAIDAGFRRKTWQAPSDADACAVAIAKRFPDWTMQRK
jgi:hypothetical protein